MATDGPDPTPCDYEIFREGKGVCLCRGGSNAIERWVKSIANKAEARVDWHFSGGIGNVLHLGDEASRQRVLNAIRELESTLKGRVLRIDGPSLYRDGDPLPEGVIAVDTDGCSGEMVRTMNLYR